MTKEEKILIIRRLREELDFAKIHFENLSYQLEKLEESLAVEA